MTKPPKMPETIYAGEHQDGWLWGLSPWSVSPDKEGTSYTRTDLTLPPEHLRLIAGALMDIDSGTNSWDYASKRAHEALALIPDAYKGE